MSNKKLITHICVFISLFLFNVCHAQDENIFGQTIQIRTQFHSFIGKPSWLLMIRDLDHNENIPYLFDISRGENFWVAPTYSRNYVISASTLKISTYRSHFNTYRRYTINDFCHLESNGRIIRDESIYITISGDLSPFDDSYHCQISRYQNASFTVANPTNDETN